MNIKDSYSKVTPISMATSKQEYSRVQDYAMLVKVRLSMTVVLTSLMGYLIMSGANFQWVDLVLLGVGGFLVTGAANAINEVLEKDYDALMKRTADRPVAAGRMSTSEAVVFAGITCLLGVTCLSLFNPITGVLGMMSFVIYSFIYTPMKRVDSISVAIGAIPGALPLLIGCTAFEGKISVMAICLFSIQFLWQFPHFLSIGYLGFDDYKNAGYKLVPDVDGKIDSRIGNHAFLYALLILPLSLYMSFLGLISIAATALLLILSLGFVYFAYKFMHRFDKVTARSLMFSSFVFIPLYLLICLIF